MISNFKKILLIILFISNYGFGQTNEIKIRFIGNCGLHLSDGKSDLYIDFPYKSGAHNYMEYDKSEIENVKDNSKFLFTHRHSDHYSKKLLKELKNKHKENVFGNWNVEKLEQLNNSIDDFKIEAFKTSHKFTFKHYSYLITWHSKKLYFTGDTGELEVISKIKNIDWAFINPWLFMNAKAEKVIIDAKMFGIYHLYPNQKIIGEMPKNIVILKEQNKIISIPY